MKVEAVTLEGQHVRSEPMREDHADGLVAAGVGFGLFRYFCFERLGCNRVEFKTDARDARSRAALARIGAREEGIFRAHMVMPDGHLRDSVYFSVIASEWSVVKPALERKLARPH